MDRDQNGSPSDSEFRRGGDEGGFSMVTTMISLVVVAVGVVLLLTTTLHSGGAPSSGGSGSPEVALADRTQAQQSLSAALTAAETAAAAGSGYGGLTAAQLQASNPAITFLVGPSSGPTTVSIAVNAGVGDAGSTGGTGVGGVGGVAGVAGVPGVSGDAGSVTLADRSSDGVCWLAWKSSGADTWYGAQTGLSSCAAPALSAAPAPTPVSSTSIGWQEGSFPSP